MLGVYLIILKIVKIIHNQINNYETDKYFFFILPYAFCSLLSGPLKTNKFSCLFLGASIIPNSCPSCLNDPMSNIIIANNNSSIFSTSIRDIIIDTKCNFLPGYKGTKEFTGVPRKGLCGKKKYLYMYTNDLRDVVTFAYNLDDQLKNNFELKDYSPHLPFFDLLFLELGYKQNSTVSLEGVCWTLVFPEELMYHQKEQI